MEEPLPAQINTPPDYRPLDPDDLIAVLAEVQVVAARLGGEPRDWQTEPLLGGNLNSLHVVRGPAGAICAKQALPYLRILGEGTPMPLSRIAFEQAALTEHARHAPERVAEPLHFDSALYLMVSDFLSPHVTLREGLMRRRRFPWVAAHVGDYLAKTTILTSDLAVPAADRRQRAASMAGNGGMYKFMEDLAFTEPYINHPRNAWNRPHLDVVAAGLRSDAALKAAVCRLKHAYLTQAESLAHGDLHTGSVLVTTIDSRVIDLELSGYLPMGYDLGILFGHLLINALSQDGHDDPENDRAGHQDWVLATIEGLWRAFVARFADLWQTARTGDAYPPALADDSARDALLARILARALGFGGVEIIRRIINVGQVDDLEWIDDRAARAIFETKCIKLAREMVLGAEGGLSLPSVCAQVRALINCAGD